MKTKRFFIGVIAFVLSMLIIIAGMQILIDPLFMYHKPFMGLQPVVTNERYQNAGIARNFDYDNVIIGNSMSENFQASWFSDAYESKTVKLVAAGSHPLDWTCLLRIIERREKQPQRIILNLDGYTFGASTSEMRHELPEYLYDNSILNDVNYLYNFSILNDYTLKMLRLNRKGNVPDVDTAFVWDDGTVCGEAVVRENYEADFEGGESSEYTNELAMANMNLLLPYIQRMENTEFVFFCSPWSMLYWRDVVMSGHVESIMQIYENVIGDLMNHSNVSVYFWNDDEIFSIMGNLDNYRDTTHYSKEVSREIANRICHGYGKLEKDSYQAEIEIFFEYINDYDYSRWQEW